MTKGNKSKSEIDERLKKARTSSDLGDVLSLMESEMERASTDLQEMEDKRASVEVADFDTYALDLFKAQEWVKMLSAKIEDTKERRDKTREAEQRAAMESETKAIFDEHKPGLTEAWIELHDAMEKAIDAANRVALHHGAIVDRNRFLDIRRRQDIRFDPAHCRIEALDKLGAEAEDFDVMEKKTVSAMAEAMIPLTAGHFRDRPSTRQPDKIVLPKGLHANGLHFGPMAGD